MENFEHPLVKEATIHLKQMIEAGARSHADYISPEKYRELLEAEGPLKGKKIVELGAGIVRIGRNAIETNYEEALVEKGAVLIPVDLIDETIKTWNITRGQDAIKVAPLQADILKLPFPDESIDGCVSANVVNFYPTLENPDCHLFAYKLLREAHRVVKKGGFIIISSFGYTKTTHMSGAVTYNNRILEHQIVTPSEIKHMALQLGFSSVEEIPLEEEELSNSTRKMNANLGKDIKRKEILYACGFLLKK